MIDHLNERQGQLARNALHDRQQRRALQASLDPLVKHHVQKWLTRLPDHKIRYGITSRELESVAWSGLDRAVQKFNENPRFRLGTYFSVELNQAIRSHLLTLHGLADFTAE